MKLICATNRSAVFEMDFSTPYYAPYEYDVLLDGVKVKACKENVFSVYSLNPDTEYTVQANGERVTFTTAKESAFVDVRFHGVIGDGFYDDTMCIQTALNTAPEGATVYFGKGVYRSSSLFIKSNITVYLDKGAVILGVNDRKRYPVLPSCVGDGVYLTSWEGEAEASFASLINISGASNVAITGEGVIDADAQHGDWWRDPKTKRIAWRPRTIQIVNSDSVVIEGVTVQNSYSWTVHPLFSKNVKLLNISIKNPSDSPNTDGIDPESCDGVDIIGVNIHVGDDCIALKSCKYELAMKVKKPCINITVRNCHLDSGHGGVVIGSEMSGGVKNVVAENCLMTSTDRGLRIKTRRGRGKMAVISNLVFKNVEMRDVKTPFVMNMFYFCDVDGHSEYVQSRSPLEIDDRTPFLDSFVFENINAVGACHAGCYFDGLPEQPIKSIKLKNVKISFTREEVSPGLAAMSDGCKLVAKQALYAENVSELVLENVEFSGYDGEKLILKNVDSCNEI
ncbi:MAG: glycoside hydrolase family 28 protein [Ruminococcaceae bacterium]|nr:glycoside hydrolase family 28 protein [Oscillospiraceae bacterium]